MTTTIEIPETVKRIVRWAIEHKAWQSSAEKDAILSQNRPSRELKAAIRAYVQAEYTAAGAGFAGRWQGK